jgi:hypothetical protein
MATDLTGKAVTITINADVTVDLAGHNLAAKNVTGFGNLIDSTDGVGSVVADKLWFNSHDNGGYMPLKDGDCYRLFAVVLANRGVQVNTSNPNKIKVGFSVRFSNVKAYDLLIAAVKDGDIRTTAIFGEEGNTDEATFTSAKIITHLEKARDQLQAGQTVTNAITGTMTFEDLDSYVDIFAELLSETGVIIASKTIRHEK